ncbi:class I SAM-dependent methyltransferase [Streptomyces hoynatensis]|uniref:class I SAM-dependent methyltransferase n=1 Tax=Streptomyces hoynatensis TaxID=1141874 RepID=UPI001F4EA4BD|nr:class I SAM-dependent methyltransferase [Streptomyces hoynatensis]
MGVSTARARLWVERWERQQQRYAIDREERFTVIADVVEHVTARQRRPLVLDLGCGPGSLAARLARRLPRAEIVGVDMDPLLLALARAHRARAARYVEAVIGEDGWIEALGLRRAPDAAVATTALHYLPEPALLRTYRELAALLRPGGVLVNADHLFQDAAPTSAVTWHVGRRRAQRLREREPAGGGPGGRGSRRRGRVGPGERRRGPAERGDGQGTRSGGPQRAGGQGWFGEPAEPHEPRASGESWASGESGDSREPWDSWESWWRAIAGDPELTGLFAERERRRAAGSAVGNNGLTLSRHVALLREAGFDHVSPVWQFGDSHVLVALR